MTSIQKLSNILYTARNCKCSFCQRGEMSSSLNSNARIVSNALAEFCDVFGYLPIVHSFYRCPDYNRRVDGAKKSYHLQALAIDFRVNKISSVQVYTNLKSWINEKFGKHCGAICYNGFVHFDMRANQFFDDRRTDI